MPGYDFVLKHLTEKCKNCNQQKKVVTEIQPHIHLNTPKKKKKKKNDELRKQSNKRLLRNLA